MEIQTIIDNLELYYYNNIKDKIELDNINDHICEKIKSMKTTISESETENVYTDEYIYKKDWNKLNKIHKRIKLKEFINNLTINNIEKTNLIKQVYELVKLNKLTQKKTVNYDSNEGIIQSIPSLKFINNRYELVL